MGGEQPGLGVRRGSGGARVYAPREARHRAARSQRVVRFVFKAPLPLLLLIMLELAVVVRKVYRQLGRAVLRL